MAPTCRVRSLLFVWLFFGLHVESGCWLTSLIAVMSRRRFEANNPDPANASPEDLSLLASVIDAEQLAQHNVVTLPNPNAMQHDADSEPGVERPMIGQRKTLTCRVGDPLATLLSEIVWTQRKPFVLSNYLYNSQRYVGPDISVRGHGNSLDISNVTHNSTGTYTCYQRCPATYLCPLRSYALLPRPRNIGDVFEKPLDITLLYPHRQFSATCWLQFDCSPDADAYFIWKYNGAFISAPSRHFLHKLGKLFHSPFVQITEVNYQSELEEPPYCAQTITVFWSKPHSGGQIECWARSDTEQETWFIQRGIVAF
ncbi:uncharacterized protein LOC129597366 [Paramacrobiotus metropolitanus]|uniref:uncharacterized protein LOC129597366 n=1 Tax=Paramacrobiotus metropolitanus TaxID=2943436 RepID=UPI0024457F44|nr:uncharacterized protein LOC129597366 [Paramacrobiotus metropolitanus]XP_055350847.1 uncharacterized protein LOC129597366 [Paramacrobiotus metropolitanus]XP_055350856.1 uncharacterized protein LOC129597366 [Paramacrobiotus metropolitanus]